MKKPNRTALLASLVFCCLFAQGSETNYQTEIIVEGLDNPWSVAFVSEREWLVAERSGSLRLITDGVLNPEPVAGVPEVLFAGQGGLAEVLLHPKFSENKLIYLSFAGADGEQKKLNRLVVVRGQLEGNSLVSVETIFGSEPLRKTAAHYGARIRFMADGTLLLSLIHI